MSVVISAAARDTWRRFRDDMRALPRGTWRRWIVTIVLGWIICAALSAGMTKWAQKADPQWLRGWDERKDRCECERDK